jgi:uncharacterized RDD family membrane protein YckC
MKTGDFRWPFLLIVASILVVGNLVEPTSLGISAEWSDEGYRIAGGTAVWALVFSVMICILYLWLLYAPSNPSKVPVPGLVRRFFAFWIDFILAVMVIAPVVGLIPMVAEWKNTGVFVWNFARTTPQSGDALIVSIMTVLAAVGILAFYAIPLTRSRPSPGACVAGYQIVVIGHTPLTLRNAILRTFLGFLAAATAYLAPFLGRNRRLGQFWLDKVFATQAVKLR